MIRFEAPASLQPLLHQCGEIARVSGVAGYVVGGTVRDVLLGRATRDLDLAVDGDAMGVAQRIARALSGHFVELDDVNAVARVVLDEGPVRYIDVAQLQGTLDQDMRRRDFTIDALAVPLDGGAVIDVGGGLDDLAACLVRMNGADVFDADSLRLLRGVRIAAELGFELEPATEEAIRERASRVTEAAAERRRDELARIFSLDGVYAGLRLLDRVGLLDVLLPELAVGKGVMQPGEFHAYDVFEHALRAVEAMDVMLAPVRPGDEHAWMWDELWRAFGWDEAELRAYLAEEMSEGRSRASLLKLATLLHDVAKPQTREVRPGGRVRFFGHADLGAQAAARLLRRYRFSAKEVRFVSVLVVEHLRPVQLAQPGEAPTRRALYRFHRDLGDAARAVLLLALADAAGARGPQMTSEGWSRHVRYMNSLLVRSMKEEGIVDPPRLLTGDDIISKLGVPEGPAIGRLLEALREAQAAGEVTDLDGALEFVERLVREPERAQD
ncbi:MAG: HDIG domain-containing metalloprotein [Chloroflexota bacterium]